MEPTPAQQDEATFHAAEGVVEDDAYASQPFSSSTPSSSYGVEASREIPPQIRLLTNLEVLRLGENQLNVSIPLEIGHLKSLVYLSLHANDLHGCIPNSLGNLSNVAYLYLRNNQLSCSIPSEIGNLSNLIDVDMQNNSLTGLIPSSIGNPGQLTWLYIYQNQISGSIPPEIGNLKSLNSLLLQRNNLSGPIPSSLGALSNLTFLILFNNQLSGTIPKELGNSKFITNLHLSENQLNGTVPVSLGNLSHLENLLLRDNQLSGPIPQKIGNLGHLPWKYMKILDLHSNMLQGPLPVPSLYTSFSSVSRNNLIGEIPSLICSLNSLQYLDLSFDHLNNMISLCLGNLSDHLIDLDLQRNNLHGTIPKTFAKGCYLKSLKFNGNQLEGSLPQSLVHCRKLEVLDFGNNKINSTFPSWPRTLPELRVLILRSNSFHGAIGNPKTKFTFPNLRIIDFSHNEFHGVLPTNFFKYLKAIIKVNAGKDLHAFVRHFHLVNKEDLEVVLKAELFLNEVDNQVKAAYKILGYDPAQKSFPVPTHIIRARSSSSHQATEIEEGKPKKAGEVVELSSSEDEFSVFNLADQSEDPSGDLGDPHLSEADLQSLGVGTQAEMGLKRQS
nr:probable leucine-rich repeat receptor-like protein kinase At1g35710 [Quercus suber]